MQNGLRELRKGKGWTQVELSRKSGVNRTIIARYETGKNRLSEKNMIRIANALNVPVDALLKGGQNGGEIAECG